MKDEPQIVEYLDGFAIYRENPDFARDYFLPDDQELESIFGPAGAEGWKELERILGKRSRSLA